MNETMLARAIKSVLVSRIERSEADRLSHVYAAQVMPVYDVLMSKTGAVDAIELGEIVGRQLIKSGQVK